MTHQGEYAGHLPSGGSVPWSNEAELARCMVLALSGDRVAYEHVLRCAVEIIRRSLSKRGVPEPLHDVIIERCLATVHAARHTFRSKRSVVRWVEAIADHHAFGGPRFMYVSTGIARLAISFRDIFAFGWRSRGTIG